MKNSFPFENGSKVLVRTVTYHHLGEVVSSDGDWVRLTNASWLAESGRFGAALASGNVSEVECAPPAYTIAVSKGAIVDVWPWEHALPSVTK